MALRPRGGGLSIWAAILAVYALLLHAPVMAAVGHVSAGVVVSVSGHDHGAANEADASPSGSTCCIICGGGPCAVGPANVGGIVLPHPQARSRRVRAGLRARFRPERRWSWFAARGPPPVV